MTIKTFFMILAVLAVVHGIGFVLVPDQVASAYGVATSASSRLMAQLFGGALLAWMFGPRSGPTRKEMP